MSWVCACAHVWRVCDRAVCSHVSLAREEAGQSRSGALGQAARRAQGLHHLHCVPASGRGRPDLCASVCRAVRWGWQRPLPGLRCGAGGGGCRGLRSGPGTQPVLGDKVVAVTAQGQGVACAPGTVPSQAGAARASPGCPLPCHLRASSGLRPVWAALRSRGPPAPPPRRPQLGLAETWALSLFGTLVIGVTLWASVSPPEVGAGCPLLGLHLPSTPLGQGPALGGGASGGDAV